MFAARRRFKQSTRPFHIHVAMSGEPTCSNLERAAEPRRWKCLRPAGAASVLDLDPSPGRLRPASPQTASAHGQGAESWEPYFYRHDVSIGKVIAGYQYRANHRRVFNRGPARHHIPPRCIHMDIDMFTLGPLRDAKQRAVEDGLHLTAAWEQDGEDGLFQAQRRLHAASRSNSSDVAAKRYAEGFYGDFVRGWEVHTTVKGARRVARAVLRGYTVSIVTPWTVSRSTAESHLGELLSSSSLTSACRRAAKLLILARQAPLSVVLDTERERRPT